MGKQHGRIERLGWQSAVVLQSKNRYPGKLMELKYHISSHD
jgi:hypothetical protein